MCLHYSLSGVFSCHKWRIFSWSHDALDDGVGMWMDEHSNGLPYSVSVFRHDHPVFLKYTDIIGEEEVHVVNLINSLYKKHFMQYIHFSI